MLNKIDIKFQARTAILYCYKTDSSFSDWAEPKDFQTEDLDQILQLFNNIKFRKLVLDKPAIPREAKLILDKFKKGIFKNVQSETKEGS